MLQTGTTTYTPSRRYTLVLAAVLLLTFAAPFLVLIDEDGVRRYSEGLTRNPFGFAAGGIFWLIFLTVIIAAVRANYLTAITCGPDAFKYRLPHVSTEDFFRRPFALRTGEISYSMISGIEKRREKLRKWGRTCTAVCLIVRDQPLETFVRGGAGDHQWVEAFARDVAARAHVPLVDRGTAASMWAAWR